MNVLAALALVVAITLAIKFWMWRRYLATRAANAGRSFGAMPPAASFGEFLEQQEWRPWRWIEIQ